MFPLLLLAVAFYLLVGVELFYVADLFGNRMNTVFKVYFQVWLLLAIVGAYGVYYILTPGLSSVSKETAERSGHGYPSAQQISLREEPSPLPLVGVRLEPALSLSKGWGLRWRWRLPNYPIIGRYAWAGVVLVLLAASLYYPVGAVLDRTGILAPGHTLKDNTLDGLAFLKASDPGEYAAIEWLRDKAPWGRIVEAVGGDYSDYGRVSASTGRPTVLGWQGHEHQWRGTTRVFDGREADVAQIYRSNDEAEVRRLLDRYNIRYVYVGNRERTSYGGEHLAKFNGFMRTAFEQHGVIIYERLEA